MILKKMTLVVLPRRTTKTPVRTIALKTLATAETTVAERVDTEDAATSSRGEYVGLPATRGHEKPRVVVLGTGWGACRLLKELDTRIYDIVCISPRNHMVSCLHLVSEHVQRCIC